MAKTVHKPGPDVLKRIEELLRDELREQGIDVEALPPHEIAESMRCGVHPDGALSYVWQGEPLLDALPEREESGSVKWKLLTRADYL